MRAAVVELVRRTCDRNMAAPKEGTATPQRCARARPMMATSRLRRRPVPAGAGPSSDGSTRCSSAMPPVTAHRSSVATAISRHQTGCSTELISPRTLSLVRTSWALPGAEPSHCAPPSSDDNLLPPCQSVPSDSRCQPPRPAADAGRGGSPPRCRPDAATDARFDRKPARMLAGVGASSLAMNISLLHAQTRPQLP